MTRKFANSSGVDIKIQGSVVRKANKAIHSLSSESYPLDSAYPFFRGSTSTCFRHSLGVSLSVLEVS